MDSSQTDSHKNSSERQSPLEHDVSRLPVSHEVPAEAADNQNLSAGAPSRDQSQKQGAPQDQSAKDKSKKPPKFRRLKRLALLAAVIFIPIFGFRILYHILHFVSTDDAQVAAHTAVLSARISGTVQQVLVDENQSVKQGQLLVTIDSRDTQNAVTQAAGDLESTFARQKEAEKNFKRAKALLASDSITKQEYDDAESQYQDLTKKLAAQVAATEQAKLNLDYTHIIAPTDGIIGTKSVEPGIVVSPGQALMIFVESTDRWVVANFKETQLRQMKLGQEADITIDAIAGKSFKGKVESFAPGTGATFALIPPDNATGNFTKIVQRVPVKIVFDKDSIKGYEDRIRPGLSADVSVRVK